MERPVWRVLSLVGFLAMCVATLLNTSCSTNTRPRVYPVTGTVLCNGRPAAGARVVFHPRDEGDSRSVHPAGNVSTNGTFTLTTYQTGDGAPEGEYTVVVIWPETGTLKRVGARDLLDGRYNSAVSPLRARVLAVANNLPPFELN